MSFGWKKNIEKKILFIKRNKKEKKKERKKEIKERNTYN
jgi:hypothetical protein